MSQQTWLNMYRKITNYRFSDERNWTENNETAYYCNRVETVQPGNRTAADTADIVMPESYQLSQMVRPSKHKTFVYHLYNAV